MKSHVSWIRRTIRALVAPKHELSLPRVVWAKLIDQLVSRGGNVRESGAFLLGNIHEGRREAVSFALYDDLEPGCLDRGYVNFTAAGYRKLWPILKNTGLTVVADIHTHPRGATQSAIDRDNPMMPSAGHMALIVPNYARGRPTPINVSFNIYLGGGQWSAHPPGRSAEKVYVGLWS